MSYFHSLYFYELKIKTESNSTWNNFNSFPLPKRTSSSPVDFSQLSDLKKCTQNWVIWVNSKLIKRAISGVSVWVYVTYNRICMLDINAHYDQDYTGIEFALIFSAAWLKHGTLTITPRRHSTVDFLTKRKTKFVDVSILSQYE